ncbi:unnamed protein product, partial [Mesorhabditis spiculigera]
MGEPLYDQVVGKVSEGKLGRPCRIYAPVGTHETLLAYLVRRLLENGANTSFVNRIADHSVSIQELVADPIALVEGQGAKEDATEKDVDNALQCAVAAGPIWQSTPAQQRAAILARAADRMEAQIQPLMGLLTREAGKTYANGIAEVREAVDFLRYYAVQAARELDNDNHRPLGPVVCISPWNFPLAIFTGQIAAALAAGNPVLAKPAEQTPLVATQAVRILLDAGIPEGVLQLLPGDGARVGARLVNDARIRGVMFTGSTEVARLLQRSLAGRLDSQGRTLPLIAETGGQNAMIVDSSALTEQVVQDVVASAFDSAGQRCSALRVLCVQEDVADRVLEMLRGAMAECHVGNLEMLNIDVGPVIDGEARDMIERHIGALRQKGRKVFQGTRIHADSTHGTFRPPTVIELEDFDELEREIFGPVLHVIRYARKDLPALLEQINGTGYGPSLGLHTRIDETIASGCNRSAAKDFPERARKQGPLYLLRLLSNCPADSASKVLNRRDVHGEAESEGRQRLQVPLKSLIAWAQNQPPEAVGALIEFVRLSESGTTRVLPGPTGERNTYSILPRNRVLCLAERKSDLLIQLGAALAVGAGVLLCESTGDIYPFVKQLPTDVQARIDITADWTSDTADFDAVIYHGDSDRLRQVSQAIAVRPGAIIGVQGLEAGDTAINLERLVIERAVSVNTAAAGGNASLMSIG